MPYWHSYNPYADCIVYVPTLEELAECISGGTIRKVNGQVVPYDVQHIVNSWLKTSKIYNTYGWLDAYILPQPSGMHDAGVRYGKEPQQYFSPMVRNRDKLNQLLEKYRYLDV